MKQDHLASSIGIFDHETPAKNLDTAIEEEFGDNPQSNTKLEEKKYQNENELEIYNVII